MRFFFLSTSLALLFDFLLTYCLLSPILLFCQRLQREAPKEPQDPEVFLPFPHKGTDHLDGRLRSLRSLAWWPGDGSADHVGALRGGLPRRGPNADELRADEGLPLGLAPRPVPAAPTVLPCPSESQTVLRGVFPRDHLRQSAASQRPPGGLRGKSRGRSTPSSSEWPWRPCSGIALGITRSSSSSPSSSLSSPRSVPRRASTSP